MDLTFFNPGTLLADPDVAVNAPPVGNSSIISGALMDAFSQVRDTVKKKRDMDNLANETFRLAEYVKTQSPELADYLNKKATSYDLLTTDPTKERSELMTGTLGFLGAETQRLKALRDESTIRLENTYKYKLQGAQKTYELLLRDQQRHEQEENDRIAAEERARSASIKAGIVTPDPVRRPWSKQAELDKAKQNLDTISNMTPDEVAALSTPISKKNVTPSLIGGSAPAPMDAAGNWEPQPPVPQGDLEATDMPSGPAQVDSSLFGDAAPPAGSELPAPAIGSDSLLTETPAATPAAEPTTGLLGDVAPKEMSPANKAAAANAELIKQFQDSRIKRIDRIARMAEGNRKYYESEEQLAAFLKTGKELEAEIKAVRNPGSPLWQETIDDIVQGYKDDMAQLAKRTVVQEDKKAEEDNAATVMMKVAGDDTGDEFPAKAKQVGGRIQYFTENVQTGKYDVPATDRVRAGELIPQWADFELDPNNPKNIQKKSMNPASGGTSGNPVPSPASPAPATKPGKVSVTPPGAIMPSAISTLLKIAGAALK